MATLGSLVVSLEANIVKFTEALSEAAEHAEKIMNRISKAVSTTTNLLKDFGAGFSIYEIVAFASEITHAAAELSGFSSQTGLTVPALSALSNEALKAGTNIEEVADAINKLEKNSAAATTGNLALQNQFKAIGITVDQLKDGLKDPDKLLLITAQALSQYADDGNKATVMQELFSKSGAKFNELLKAIATNGYAAATVTAEQAEQFKKNSEALQDLETNLKGVALSFIGTLVPAVKFTTAAVAAAFENIWIDIKTQFEGAYLTIKGGLQDLDTLASNVGRTLKGAIGINSKSLDVPKIDYDKQTKDLVAAAERLKAINNQAVSDIYDDIYGDKKKKEEEKKPSVAVVRQAPKLPSGQDGLLKSLDEQIKLLDAALKSEEALFKNQNLALDTDYKNNNSSLAGYTTEKNAILKADYDKTNSLYNAEIAVTQGYIAKIQAALDVEKNRKVDDTQSVQQAARIAQKQQELDQATSKLNALRENQATNSTKELDLQIEATGLSASASSNLANTIVGVEIAYANLTGDLAKANALQAQQTDGQKLAALQANSLTGQIDKLAAVQARSAQLAAIAKDKPINDTNIAYLNLIGSTEQAAILQDKLNDEQLRYQLTTLGAVDALHQLDAIEKDRALRASTNPLAGAQRALIDYQKSLNDVAKATEAMTTKLFSGIEDALVSFVQTGKISFKSLIDSMIADLIRLAIRQQVMPFVAQLFGAALGAFGAGAGSADLAGTYAAEGPPVPGRAVGGAVNQGQEYTVGERGPEKFVPSVQGSIVPNGGSMGAQSINYSPTIQIDSRSDRAQVLSDTQNMIRQGNKELIGLLQRYNPGLRS